MIRLLLDAALALYVLPPVYPYPVQFTASTAAGAQLAFMPGVGWVGPNDCRGYCITPAGEATGHLLSGEIGLQTLADLSVTIYRNGEPVVWCYKFFGDRPVCSAKQE